LAFLSLRRSTSYARRRMRRALRRVLRPRMVRRRLIGVRIIRRRAGARRVALRLMRVAALALPLQVASSALATALCSAWSLG